MSKTYRWPLDMSKFTLGDAIAMHKASKSDPDDAILVFAVILDRLTGVDAKDLPYPDAMQFFNEAGDQLSAYFQTIDITRLHIEIPDAFRAAIEDIDDLEENDL